MSTSAALLPDPTIRSMTPSGRGWGGFATRAVIRPRQFSQKNAKGAKPRLGFVSFARFGSTGSTLGLTQRPNYSQHDPAAPVDRPKSTVSASALGDAD